MNNDLISIIIPVYNQSKYVGKCIESVIDQTYTNIEIIVINDGSTDNSLEIIKKYNDKRIKVINQNNQGVYKTRCNGIKLSKGKYIFFLDSDDFIEKNCIKKLYMNVNKYNADVVRCNFKKLKNTGYVSNITKLKPGVFLKKDFQKNIYKYIFTSFDLNSVCMQLIKKKVLKNISDTIYDIKYGEDLLFNCLIIDNSSLISIIDDELYIYRDNSEGCTKKVDLNSVLSKASDVLKYCNILDEYIDKWSLNKEIYKSYLNTLMHKNIIYVLLLLDNKKMYNLVLDYIYKDECYNKISKYSLSKKEIFKLKDIVNYNIINSILKRNKFMIYIKLKFIKKIIK